jgi:hypothetical protein
MAHNEDDRLESDNNTLLPSKNVFFIEVAFTSFYELFYLKYFNFKDWMKYMLKCFLKCSIEVPDDGVIAETCCTYM